MIGSVANGKVPFSRHARLAAAFPGIGSALQRRGYTLTCLNWREIMNGKSGRGSLERERADGAEGELLFPHPSTTPPPAAQRWTWAAQSGGAAGGSAGQGRGGSGPLCWEGSRGHLGGWSVSPPCCGWVVKLKDGMRWRGNCSLQTIVFGA